MIVRVKRVRQKACEQCNKIEHVLYRIRVEPSAPWQFVCKPCLLPIREASAAYQYGGTWKSKKRT